MKLLDTTKKIEKYLKLKHGLYIRDFPVDLE